MKPLTPRQKEVLRLIAVGDSAKMVAGKLEISEHGVEMHVLRIKQQLGLETTIALVHYALRHRLVKNLCRK